MSLLPPPLLLPSKLLALLPGRSRKLGIPEPQLLFPCESKWSFSKKKNRVLHTIQHHNFKDSCSSKLLFTSKLKTSPLFAKSDQPRVPKTWVAGWHCHPESFCASGKFLRVTLKIALRSFRTLWKISR